MPKKLQELWSELYEKKGQGWLTVLSGSMSPVLQIGDKIFIKYISPKRIRFGDIIVFKENDRLIVHRVIGKGIAGNKPVFLEKGDNNIIASCINAEKVIGKAIYVVKGNKYIRLDNYQGKCANLIHGARSYVFYTLFNIASLLNSIKRKLIPPRPR